MIVTVFRSRLREDLDPEEYARRSAEVAAVGTRMPGFVSLKTFTADDGERLTLAEFETMEDQKAWARERIHRQAQLEGRERFYAEFCISICEEVDRRTFSAGAKEESA